MTEEKRYNCIILLGPTACGKTGLGVKIADSLTKRGIVTHIISADSRQVYRGLDIGSGKDLCEFTLDAGTPDERTMPYHLIDIADVTEEYSVYNFQSDFYRVFAELLDRNILPLVVGGTGMYIDSIVRGYKMGQVGINIELRKNLQGKSIEELVQILSGLKKRNGTELHNTTDTLEHHRLLRAIEIETWNAEHPDTFNSSPDSPDSPAVSASDINHSQLYPLILGTTFERSVVRQRVTVRLRQRLEGGMIEEVARIHESGVSWERLERLGLEYKFVSQYLEGKIASREELFEKLNIAIHQFVKRQETWFRGMERKGVKIHWLPMDESRYEAAMNLIEAAGFFGGCLTDSGYVHT